MGEVTDINSSFADTRAPFEPAIPKGVSPISDWHGLSEEKHVVQFYDSHEFLMDALSNFVLKSIANGDPCIILATEQHREGVEERLRLCKFDVEAAIASGSYLPLDAKETLSRFLIDGAIEPTYFDQVIGGLLTQAAKPGHRVRVFGEMVALLWSDGDVEKALELESLWNNLHGKHLFSLFCAYPINGFDSETLALGLNDVCGAHSHVIPAESYSSLESAGDRLRNVIQLQRKARLLEAEVAERKRAEERLRLSLIHEKMARTEAENANRLKDEFLANVSHELRTPLNAIIGWAYMLGKRTLNEEAISHAVETIERNAKSQAQLIEDILDVSRVITGKLHLNIEHVDFTTVINNAIDSMRVAADSKGILLVLDLAPSERPLRGDASRLQQAVWNLLSNAIKFTPQGGRVEVQLELDDSHAQLRVTDTGVGISRDFLPFVFDRFRQADGGSTRTHGGLGLGLAIVRHLIELHGGTVAAESEGVGRGATFTVRLPIADGNSYGGRRESRSTEKGDGSFGGVDSLPRLTGLQIVLVDDDKDTLEIIAAILSEVGAIVRTASSAKDALEILQTRQTDVLVSDLAMPDDDGYTLIKSVRERELVGENQLQAIALTATVRIADRSRALSAGFNMFIAKPVVPSELIAAILNLTEVDPSHFEPARI